ncbi:MAG TPA: TonB-dependent receptor [Longimicrobiales bacterium]|nr:TonB-dependent receptor [Longimicrobiales bacterium]
MATSRPASTMRLASRCVGAGQAARLACCVALCLAAPAAAAAQSGALEVRVTARGVPVGGALVTLRTLPDTVIARFGDTDSRGRAHFLMLPAGEYEVTVRSLGFETGVATGEVLPGRSAVLEVVLAEGAVLLPQVTVEAERRRARFAETAGRTTAEITQRDLMLLPAAGGADILRAVAVLPGVVTTSDFSAAFNVRGGSADQNLILLDGLPIYNPFHLGGLFSVFNSDMIARAEMMTGGFPAEFGGRVSSVLSVESAVGGPGPDVQGGISLLAGRAAVGWDIPDGLVGAVGLGSARARISVRRSYFDQLLRPFFDFPYHLTDVQAVGEAWTADGGRLTVTGYTGRDVLDLTGSESFPLRVKWGWGNDAVGAGFTQPLGSASLLRVSGGYSRFATSIRFPEFDDTEFASRIDQLLLRSGLEFRPADNVVTGTGVALDRLRYHNTAVSGGTEFGGGQAAGWLAGTYVQGAWSPPQWVLEAGLRLDSWFPDNGAIRSELQPRAAAKRFLGSGDIALKLAAGRYTQFVHSLRDEELPLGIDVWVLSGERAPVVTSDQAQVGLEGYPTDGWFGGVEAWIRSFDGVATINAADDPNDPADDLLTGTGLSYGADMHIRREVGTLRPMLALSWLRAVREFEDVFAGTEPPPTLRYAPVFDRRVDMDFALQLLLTADTEIGLRWNFGTGLPHTRPLAAYAYYEYDLVDGAWRWPGASRDTADSAVALGPRNAERYPSYHRLDLSARRTYHRSWGTLTPHLEVLNVYNRRNVLFYFYEYGRDPPVRSGISMFPILPTAGVEVRF